METEALWLERLRQDSINDLYPWPYGSRAMAEKIVDWRIASGIENLKARKSAHTESLAEQDSR